VGRPGNAGIERRAVRAAYSTADIVRGAGFFHVPFSARAWRDAIAEYFREMS
jgi:hypothetical protein